MKINAKLLTIALILALFSIGAVAAAENVSLESSDVNTVSSEKLSVSTTQEIEINNYKISADVESSSSDVNISTDSYIKESIKENKKTSPLLGVSNEEILGTTYDVSGNTFQSIQDSMRNAVSGDIINLDGKHIIEKVFLIIILQIGQLLLSVV